jgi:hypothetical protein
VKRAGARKQVLGRELGAAQALAVDRELVLDVAPSSFARLKYSSSARIAIAVSRVFDHCAPRRFCTASHHGLDQLVLGIDGHQRAQREGGRLDARRPTSATNAVRAPVRGLRVASWCCDEPAPTRETSGVSSIRTPLCRFSSSVLARSVRPKDCAASAKSALP